REPLQQASPLKRLRQKYKRRRSNTPAGTGRITMVNQWTRDHIVWTLYVQAAKSHDKDVINALIHGMDVLLTFSALFSAIVTAFIIQNESGLNKWDIPSQNAKILVELYKIFQDPKFQNESLITINEEDSGDLEASIAFWYISFYLSLVVAGGAVCVRQWLLAYGRYNASARVPYCYGRVKISLIR
ncbi:hypothetical protein FRC03_007716, partial [Tulasnella sp. 419]